MVRRPPLEFGHMTGVLDDIAHKLSCVAGIQALTALLPAGDNGHEYSDADIVLYYSGTEPFCIEEIRAIAASVTQEGQPLVTGLHEWGEWANGGARVLTRAGRLNFLYRDLRQVRAAIDQACQGACLHERVDHPAQRYYHFYSTTYLAEIEKGAVVHDPRGWIVELRHQIAIYPPRLKVTVLRQELQSAEHALMHGRDLAGRGDVFGTVELLARVASHLTQAVFALNEVYFTNDEYAASAIASLRLAPSWFGARLSKVLAHPGLSAGELSAAVSEMTAVWADVVDLTSGQYQPHLLPAHTTNGNGHGNGNGNGNGNGSSRPTEPVRTNGHDGAAAHLRQDNNA